jgi:glycosyltransferase involved in cell wall biosynthesis
MSSVTLSRPARIAVLATGSASGEKGGAERFYNGLRDALIAAGADAQIHWEVSDECSFEAIKESYLRFYDCDLTSYDGVISTKAPGYMIRHRNHICYLQHTMRVFYDMFDVEFPKANPEHHRQRQLIHRLDTEALRPARTRTVFAIGHEVRERLNHFNALDADVLYQASTMSGFYCGESRYFLLPGRLHRWKRVGLAIEAMNKLDTPVDLLISGVGEDEAEFRAMAASNPRIHFLGRVSDAELIRLYADSLGVLFVPLREDFGLVTLEAFLSGKPVITCTDSGEPARLVRDGVTGFVVPPNPAGLAAAMRSLACDTKRAVAMGQEGRCDAQKITWDKVGETLLTALGFGQAGLDQQISERA